MIIIIYALLFIINFTTKYTIIITLDELSNNIRNNISTKQIAIDKMNYNVVQFDEQSFGSKIDKCVVFKMKWIIG